MKTKINAYNGVDYQGCSDAGDHIESVIFKACRSEDPEKVLAKVHLFYRYLGSLHALRKHGECLDEEISSVAFNLQSSISPIVHWLQENGKVIHKDPFGRNAA